MAVAHVITWRGEWHQAKLRDQEVERQNRGLEHHPDAPLSTGRQRRQARCMITVGQTASRIVLPADR
jgi:hypothetical protein